MTLETLVKLLKMHKLNKRKEQMMIHLVPEIKGLKHKNVHKIWPGHEHVGLSIVISNYWNYHIRTICRVVKSNVTLLELPHQDKM
jgi:hypothetical protein